MKAKQRKEWTQRQKTIIGTIIIAVLSAIMAGVGLAIGLFVSKPMYDEQFRDCKIVAQRIYDQLDHKMIEVPKGYSIEMTKTEIIVRKDGYSGEIKATLKDGNLVFEQTDRNADALMWAGGACIVGLIAGYIIARKKKLIED